MLVMKERQPPFRTAERWARLVLLEVGAIRECEEHGWMRDRSDPHARARPFHRATRAASRYLFGASGCYGLRRVGYDRRHLSRVPARVIGAWLRLRRYADLRCLDAGFLAVVSLAPVLPWIGISISFWPADALRVFLSGFAGGEDALPILWRNASIKSTTFPPLGRAFVVTGFPAHLLLMSSTSAASY
jgi:hypothetical protein